MFGYRLIKNQDYEDLLAKYNGAMAEVINRELKIAELQYENSVLENDNKNLLEELNNCKASDAFEPIILSDVSMEALELDEQDKPVREKKVVRHTEGKKSRRKVVHKANNTEK